MEVTLPKAGPMHEGWAVEGALGAVGKREAYRWAQDLLRAQVLGCLLPPQEFFLSPAAAAARCLLSCFLGRRGCPARTAEIRLLFPPGTAEPPFGDVDPQQTLPPPLPEARAGHRARAASALRRRRPSGRWEDGRSPRLCGPLLPSGGSWVSWQAAFTLPRPALAGGNWQNPALGTQPGAVFFQVRAGPGEPSVFVS